MSTLRCDPYPGDGLKLEQPGPFPFKAHGSTSGFIHSTALASAIRGAMRRGIHYERTNRTAIHFSPKAILACGRSCSHGGAGDRAVNVGCSCSTKRSGPWSRAACCEGRREEEEKEEKGR